MPHMCSIDERSRASIVHHEHYVESQHPYVDVRIPAKKAHHFESKKCGWIGKVYRRDAEVNVWVS